MLSFDGAIGPDALIARIASRQLDVVARKQLLDAGLTAGAISHRIRITGGPKAKTRKRSATFTYTGTDASGISGFQCRLDAGSFESCAGSKTYTRLKKGRHTFEVRAVDTAGNVDPTPATRTWKIKKKKRKRKK